MTGYPAGQCPDGRGGVRRRIWTLNTTDPGSAPGSGTKGITLAARELRRASARVVIIRSLLQRACVNAQNRWKAITLVTSQKGQMALTTNFLCTTVQPRTLQLNVPHWQCNFRLRITFLLIPESHAIYFRAAPMFARGCHEHWQPRVMTDLFRTTVHHRRRTKKGQPRRTGPLNWLRR